MGAPASRPGSRPADQAPSGLGATSFDPSRIAERIRQDDPYLVDYLLGWFGMGPPQPWGAAQSFALEVAYGYRLIVGDGDAHPTQLGLEVAHALAIEARQRTDAQRLDPKGESATPEGGTPNA